MKRLSILTVLLTITLYSCSEKRTDDPKKCFEYWSGEEPPEEVNLIHGQYWQSAHWTKEYIMYLELIPPKKWTVDFIRINNLTRDSTTKWNPPSDCPSWFTPGQTYLKYKISDGFDQGSRFFVDTASSKCYLYEIQL